MKLWVPYVYRVTDRYTGKWYIGSRTSIAEVCNPDELGVSYFTSSNLVHPMYKQDPERFNSEIISTFLTVEDTIKFEAELLSSLNAKDDLLSYNMHNGDGKMNVVKSGAISGKIVGRRMWEQRSGLFSEENIGKGGRASGKLAVERGTGLFSRSKEKHSEDSRKAGISARDNGRGFHSKSRDWFSEHNRKNGKNSYEQRKGVHGRTKDQMIKDTALANSQRWVCDICGMISIPMGIGRHQSFSKHVGKTRVS